MSSFFKISCPECGKSLKVPDHLAGKSRACPYCRATVRIPETAPEPEVAFPNIQVAPVDRPGAPRPAKAKKAPLQVKKAEKSWFSGGNSESASSDVGLVVSGVIAVGLTLVWYGALYPVREMYLGQLFWQRGPVPLPTTFLMFWAFAILVLKWLNLKKQREAMLLDVLPTEISEEITLDSIDSFIKNINELPGASNDTFLVNRVVRGIEHFRVRKNAAETVTMMESQSAIDANNVAGSFTILKVFIWSLPILGFIGTVMGVSSAVASLASSLSGGGSMDAMKDSLQDVFGGLGTAFDTTLLALIMSMIVKIPASALQKGEEDLITSVDEYCNENLLRRLNDGHNEMSQPQSQLDRDDVSLFRQAVEQALGAQHAELEQWLSRLDKIGERMTDQVVRGWDLVNDRIEKQQQKHVRLLHEQQLDQQARLQAQLDQMANAAEKIQKSLNSLAEQTEVMQRDVIGSFSGAQKSLEQHLSGLQSGLTKLSQVLDQLGSQQVVVQQVEASGGGGWFGRGKKSRSSGRR